MSFQTLPTKKGENMAFKKCLKKILVIFFINFKLFSLQNADIIFNKERFYKTKIMEIRKIDLDGSGERRRIYIYDDGEVEDINFVDNKITIDKLQLISQEEINFLNNISQEAIDSVKNDEIKYVQNYKNIEYEAQKNKFYFQDKTEYLGEKSGNVIFNGKNKDINYTQTMVLDTINYVENNIHLYEIRYKNKVFVISSFKKDYKNKEIRRLIDFIYVPFFYYTNIKKIKPIEDSKKNINSNIQIEKIKFLDNNNYNYSLYILNKNGNMVKTTFEETGFPNQLDIKKEEYIVKKELENYFYNKIPKIQQKNKIQLNYSYEVNSLKNIKNREVKTKGFPVIVNYNSGKIKNPIIYKIYYNSVNPYIFISNDKENSELSRNLNLLEKSKKMKDVDLKKIQDKNYDLYEYKEIPIYISSDRKVYIHRSSEMLELNLMIFNMLLHPEEKKKIVECEKVKFNYDDGDIETLRNNDYILFPRIYGQFLSSYLRNKWNYEGKLKSEVVAEWYKQFEDVCGNLMKNNFK